MNAAGSPSIMLNYPDYVNRKRVSWEPYKNRIEHDIQTLLRYKNWKEIATHNPKENMATLTISEHLTS